MKVFIILFSITITLMVAVIWLATNDPHLATKISASVQNAAESRALAPEKESVSLLTAIGWLVAALVLMGLFKVIVTRLFTQLNIEPVEEKQ